ncbi:MAG: ketoacyl-ACP synthase III [Gemmatimonadaceae bacterium]|nr:ketoacyl-ACP synthase III [Gemmatimonadaceae bacterium]
MDAYIAGMAYHLPERIVTNDDLQAENPSWDMARIESKVGIRARHIAGPDESASDLGFAAAEKLLTGMNVDRASVDCLLLCTQSPDYFLPTTACVLQDRLGLPTDCAALDFNQGCSGYVYGLYLAKALVASGSAKNVLLITAETYSKLIHPRDRSVRVLFGDGASATLINGDGSGAKIGVCTLGTDGAGYENLIVPAGGARRPRCAATQQEVEDENGSVRTAEQLYMDGQELFLFTLRRVPQVVDATLRRAGITRDAVDWFVFHQANAFMNDHLRTKLKIPKEKAPMFLESIGNTVSSTIPIAMFEKGVDFGPGDRVMLVGFGVGYSWGACLLEWNTVKRV